MRTVVMTGGTSGLGEVAAQRILTTPHTRLLLGARGQGPTPIETLPLDLTRLASVRSFAQAVSRTLGETPIDVLVLNAGAQFSNIDQRTADGFETTFAVNHLAHYLLLRLLLPKLAQSATVVITTSDTHDPKTNPMAPRQLDPDRLAHPPRGKRTGFAAGFRAYSASKLCDLLTARALAASPEAKTHRLIVTAYNPGLTPDTSLFRAWPLWARMLMGVARLVRPLARLNSARTSRRSARGSRPWPITPPAGRIYASLVNGRVTWPDPSELAQRGRCGTWPLARQCADGCAARAAVMVPMAMNKHISLVSLVLLLGSGFGIDSLTQTNLAPATPAAGVAAAANKFLATLDDTQRTKVAFAFDDETQRKNWSNLPTGIFRRAGLRLGDLTQPQRDAVLAVLKAALSPRGYEKVLQIVGGDEVLSKTGGGSGRIRFGDDEYYVSFLGQPSISEPWMIQFGGHHLGLNITLARGQGTAAPSHTGAQPAIYEFEGKTVRPLGRETDKAFALLSSLDAAQRKQAILGVEMRDLVLGPGSDGQTIQPEGIKGAALTTKQRELLLDLASEWTGIMHDGAAKAKMDEMRKNVGETWFAWSGPTDKGSASYFRIQGPTVLIEYAPQRLGGDPTKHVHTIYRDPTNDYGTKWWKP